MILFTLPLHRSPFRHCPPPYAYAFPSDTSFSLLPNPYLSALLAALSLLFFVFFSSRNFKYSILLSFLLCRFSSPSVVISKAASRLSLVSTEKRRSLLSFPPTLFGRCCLSLSLRVWALLSLCSLLYSFVRVLLVVLILWLLSFCGSSPTPVLPLASSSHRWSLRCVGSLVGHLVLLSFTSSALHFLTSDRRFLVLRCSSLFSSPSSAGAAPPPPKTNLAPALPLSLSTSAAARLSVDAPTRRWVAPRVVTSLPFFFLFASDALLATFFVLS